MGIGTKLIILNFLVQIFSSILYWFDGSLAKRHIHILIPRTCDLSLIR